MEIEQLEAMIGECFHLRAQYKEMDEAKKAKHAELKEKQAEVIAALEALGKDSYKSDYGNFSFYYPDSFQTPKTQEEKELFFNHLRERGGEGLFWEYASVNSKKLQGFCKGEVEIAEQNENYDYQIPGITKTVGAAIANMRK